MTHTTEVSNLILVNRKIGTNHVCNHFHDLNQDFSWDNISTPLINYMSITCIGHTFILFIDDFFRYN